MIVSHRITALPFLWIVGILPSLLFAPNSLDASPTSETARAANEHSIPEATTESFSTEEVTISSATSACPSGFWIVSSRQCRKNSFADCSSCNLRYQHFLSKDCSHPATEEDFLSSLNPGVPVCIVVHGSFVHARDVASDSAMLYDWIRSAAPCRPLHVVFFTWPSSGPCSVASSVGWVSVCPTVDVAVLGRRSAFHGLYLAQLIARIPDDHPISILGHSHGARLAVSALHLLGGGIVQGQILPYADCVSNRIRVILAAAAIDHDWLNPHERYGRALCRAECLLNLRTTHDLALLCYPLRLPFAHRSLGQAGFTSRDRKRLSWLGDRTAELDVTDLIGSGHVWSHYTNRPGIAQAIAPYVYFD